MALKDILATTQLVGSQFANAYGQGLASRQQTAIEEDRRKAREMEARKLGMVEQDYARGVEALTGQERTRAIGMDSKLKKLQDTIRAYKTGGALATPWQSTTSPEQMRAKIDSAKKALTPEQDAHLRSEARRFGIPESLAYAQMAQESAGKTGAVSSAGARGLFQLMPTTAKELGVNMDDPMQNITGGLKYLKQQIDAEGGNVAAGLARYNAGPGAYRRHMKVGLHDLAPETKQYMTNVLTGSGLYDKDKVSELTSKFGAPATTTTTGQRKLTSDQEAVEKMLPGLLTVSKLGIAAPTVGREADYGAFQRVLSSLGKLTRTESAETTGGALGGFRLKSPALGKRDEPGIAKYKIPDYEQYKRALTGAVDPATYKDWVSALDPTDVTTVDDQGRIIAVPRRDADLMTEGRYDRESFENLVSGAFGTTGEPRLQGSKYSNTYAKIKDALDSLKSGVPDNNLLNTLKLMPGGR